MSITALLASLGAPTLPQRHGRVNVNFSISGVATRQRQLDIALSGQVM